MTSPRRQLRRWMCRTGINQRDFARSIGLTPSAVCQLMDSDWTPKLATALLIQAATGGAVPADSWLSSAERDRIHQLELAA